MPTSSLLASQIFFCLPSTLSNSSLSYLMSPLNTVSCREKNRKLLEEVESAQLAAHRSVSMDSYFNLLIRILSLETNIWNAKFSMITIELLLERFISTVLAVVHLNSGSMLINQLGDPELKRIFIRELELHH